MSESEQIVRKSAIERVDEGLRQYMIKVFNYMGLSLVVTALAAYVTLYTPVINWMFSVDPAAQTVSLSAFGWIITLAPLAMIFGFNAVLNKGSMAAAQAMLWNICFKWKPILAYATTSISAPTLNFPWRVHPSTSANRTGWITG